MQPLSAEVSRLLPLFGAVCDVDRLFSFGIVLVWIVFLDADNLNLSAQ